MPTLQPKQTINVKAHGKATTLAQAQAQARAQAQAQAQAQA